MGKDFFVFFYLKIGEEYVLVCIEWKLGVGYIGFVCDVLFFVILEEDLKCCDFMVNVMVLDDDGNIIDFYKG